MTREIVDYSNKNNSFLIFTSTSDVYGNSKHFLETEKITIGPPTNEKVLLCNVKTNIRAIYF